VKNLSDIGERKAIQLISSMLSKADIAVGLGDDCAAIQIHNEYLLVTTDMISQKTHIPKHMTAFQIGWFVVAINLSDIAAKGGKPLGLVLSLGLPKQTSQDFLSQLIQGADKCASLFNTTIVGGDTKETSEITISGTAFGLVDKNKFLPRKGCLPGDVVVVSGPLGKAGAQYYLLQNELVDNKEHNALLQPIPRLTMGRFLSDQKCVTCCMDISDGLSSSLYQLSEINNVGFEIQQERIPLAEELTYLENNSEGMTILDIALHFGGDYELLFTVPRSCFESLRKEAEKQHLSLYKIGTVQSENGIFLIDGDKKAKLENKGYQHFQSSEL
jgi:thiamine-monophosphate kinase